MVPSPLPRRRTATALVLTALSGVFLASTVNAPTVGANAAVSRPSVPLIRTANGQLLFVGDSLTEGSAAFGGLRSRIASSRHWESVILDFRRGRRVTDALTVVRSRLARNRSVTAVVIALGTNDMLSRGEKWYPRSVIDRMLSECDGLPVLWVNLAFNGNILPVQKSRATRFNAALLEATADWPNLAVADWAGYFRAKGQSRFISDGIHLTNAAYVVRATWTAQRTGELARTVSDLTSTTTTTTQPPTTTTDLPATSTTIAPAPGG